MNVRTRVAQRTEATTGDSQLGIYWTILWRGRWFIASACFLVTLTAGIIAFLETPTYRASATLVIRNSPSGSGVGMLDAAASLAGVQLGSGAAIKQPVAGLTSRETTYRFIEENGIKPDLFPELWDAARAQWLTEGGKSLEPTMLATFNRFDKEIRDVSIDYDANMATLSITHTDPMKAAEWANVSAQQRPSCR